jgi:energy-converting hydrogenase Eha subunit F
MQVIDLLMMCCIAILMIVCFILGFYISGLIKPVPKKPQPVVKEKVEDQDPISPKEQRLIKSLEVKTGGQKIEEDGDD